MSFESYRQLFDGYARGRTLRAGGPGMSLEFEARARADKRYRLYVVGETAMFYQWKNEPDYPAHYHAITDALDTAHAYRAQYCLDLSSSRPERYARRVYKKVMWPPVLSYLPLQPVTEDWRVGVWAHARGLKFTENGYLRMRVELRLRREGVSAHSVAFPADKTWLIDLPEGDYDWTELEQAISIPRDTTAHVGVWFEGAGYEGEVYIERPFLIETNGHNLLPDFMTPVPDKEKFDWSAQYLSRREWPEFRVLLGGQEVFRGEVFERCHVDSEWAVDLPQELLTGDCRLTIELISDYHDPLPYVVREVGLIEQPGGELALISAAQTGVKHGKAYLLLRTGRDGVEVHFDYPDARLNGPRSLRFEKAGLHGVALDCHEAGEHARFALECGGRRIEGEIARIAEKIPDGVVTGTGDMIYIEQRMDYVEEYLSWYVSNGVGNLLTIRPTYRWCGTRVLNPEVWEVVRRVLGELGISYALMIDGRELPGINANPDDAMLAGPGYLGRQNHERDGAMYYWGTRGGKVSMMAEQVGDMEQRMYDEDPSHTSPQYNHANYIYRDGGVYLHRDPDIPHDMRAGCERSVARLSETRGGAPRHTGPSVMFKYLLDAGYSWVGAETMYGSMEPLMAFLRGATLARGIKDMGVHHAVQWSSSPQDVPEHFRRYRLALYVSYMQGATEINTEEGLWHLEEYYSHFQRFSAGCAGHRVQQQDFYRYVATHSRTGRFHAPMALLHGRYDGWHAFGHGRPWGWQGVKDSDAEKSWDLMKVIYPLSKPGDALYIYDCDTDRAVGYYTGTPLGNVDALPVESDRALMSRYGALAFMGYNCACEGDFARLRKYVEAGGRLLLTRAHMTDTTAFDDVAAYRLHMPGDLLGLGADEPVFRTSSVSGVPVDVCASGREPDEVLARTDDGAPLAVRYALGRGSVTLVNALAYPAHPAIRALYEQLLRAQLTELTRGERVWAECGDDVEFAVYDQEDGARHIYLLAVDWFRPVEGLRRATLRVGDARYEAAMPFGVMLKAVSDGERIAWPHSEAGEVLSVSAAGARVQGAGRVAFTLACGGAQRDVEVDFTDAGVVTLEF